MSTSTVISERNLAKQIIAEIVCQAGGMLTSKTELVRIFWRAHLIYAQSQAGYLSFWPLLKTAAGPVIQDADVLLGELVAERIMRIEETSSDGITGLRLQMTDNGRGALRTDIVKAIQKALAGRTEPPDLADYRSLRSWNEAEEGEELNIYLDVIPEAEYAERKQRLDEMAPVLKDVSR